MEREDIFYDTQKRFIGDLESMVKDAKDECKGNVTNLWVFDLLGGILGKVIENVKYNDSRRRELESDLKDFVDPALSKVQKHIPEIKTKDVYRMISKAGEIYDLIHERAEGELDVLEARSSSYKTSKELVEHEFEKAETFESPEKHREWVKSLSREMNGVLDYAQDLSKELLQKKGLAWKVKLGAAKAYLHLRYGVSLNVAALNKDVPQVRESILGKYSAYEEKLIKSRYNN